MKRNLHSIFACPNCHSESLHLTDNAVARCESCDEIYEIKSGTPIFVSSANQGYFEYLNHQQEVFDAAEAHRLYTAEKKSYRNCLELLSEDSELTQVVDLAAGYGGLGRMLAVEGYNPICVDINPVRLQTPAENGHLTTAAVSTDLPFPDESVDAVCMVSALPHLPDPKGTLSEIHRVLVTNGSLVLGFYNIVNVLWRVLFLLGRWDAIADRQGWHYFQSTLSARQLRQIAKEVGYRVVSDGSYTPLPRSSQYIRLPLSSLTCLRHAFRLEKGIE
jgi:ubiquinone/menaquinone biosynthesis C-methylase UbiE/uncharacterized protein YbaR (Trm112 family)